MARRAPVLPSAVAAVTVPIWVVVVAVVLGAIGTLPFFGANGSWTPEALTSVFQASTLVYLVMALGIFLSFWAIAPIRGELRVSRVVVRAMIAAAITLAPVAIFEGVGTLLILAQSAAQPQSGGLYDLVNNPPVPGPIDLGIRSVVGALELVVRYIPHIVLAALGSWAWQRRSTHGEA